ncbi:ribosomal L18 carboxy-terminal region protein [Medicago truncatula]|uniref:Ribosomal L18 carboxy-terminal region protein n=1 Tax=Medicago truncatula TaxID=3880 RepID=G7JP44_MEDTR|nr:ribosomal L18 carboxy-terminal region protein [Medicago truncatula]
MLRLLEPGEDYSVEPSDSRRPFHPLVNVGLVIRTTGNCVFGAFKGALVGTLIADDEPAKYQRQFSKRIKKGIEADEFEKLYKKVNDAIRVDPSIKKSQKHPPKQHKMYNLKKLTYEERKAKLIECCKLLTLLLMTMRMTTS